MNPFEECDQFKDHRRSICRGERLGMSLEGPNGINAYRRFWGLDPLEKKVDITSEPAQKSISESVNLPPLLIRGWNFATAMARWTLAGMPRRTQEEIEERLAICLGCKFLENSQCIRCGCACIEKNRLMNKLALTTEKCPEGKWE